MSSSSRFPRLSTRMFRWFSFTSRQTQVLWCKPRFLGSRVKMSSIGGGAGVGMGLYAAVGNPAQVASQPEEAAEKRHHLKNGKGFTNPWESYTESSFWELAVKGFIW